MAAPTLEARAHSGSSYTTLLDSTVRWAQLVEGVGLLKGFRFDDLRHTGNHLAAQTGASTRELMQRMGHSTVRAAMVYQHATDARSRELADRLDVLLREQRSAEK